MSRFGEFSLGPGLTVVQAEDLPGEFAGHSHPLLAYIDDGVHALVCPALDFHRGDGTSSKLSILVRPAPPPRNNVSADGEVISFIASGPWVNRVLQEPPPSEKLCYRALFLALNDLQVTPAIRIVDGGVAARPPHGSELIEAIIPHRGRLTHLSKALAGIRAQTTACAVTVCLDQAVDDATRRLLARDRRLQAFAVADPPHGPYVIRQHFGLLATKAFIAFQDSDDFSVPERLGELIGHANAHGADIVGSHELRLDELDEAVLAFRYPLDVNDALSSIAAHPQLFPTTIVRADQFRRQGGLSTTSTFGADSEYLLRSYFFARIANVDRFLYIRRRRAGSLTTDPSTALDSPVRLKLDRDWKTDFAAVKEGRLALPQSSIALRQRPRMPMFSRL